MYRMLLISKYLRRKLAPLFAVLAVMLCTAMVIIVISVMGGFLRMMRSAAAKLTGEVTVMSDLTGFADYQRLGVLLTGLPEVEAVTPVIRTYALLNLHDTTHTVEVVGIEPESFSRVSNYSSVLQWKASDLVKMLEETSGDTSAMPEALRDRIEQRRSEVARLDLHELAMQFKVPDIWRSEHVDHGIVPGIEVNPWALRSERGTYSIDTSAISAVVTLTVLPLTQKGTLASLSPSVGKFVVVNEFKSGLYDVDANRVYMPLAVLQRMLEMQQQEVWEQFDPQTGEPVGKATVEPARVTELMVKGRPAVPLATLKARVKEITDLFAAEQKALPRLFVQTWEERHATLLNAVEKEKGLLTVLFGVISLVAIVMIAVIFYMIVLEKTRDIGTLRALGASRGGVASIFLGYGLAIGVLGALFGLGLAAAVVWNLNEIQDLLHQWFGFKMWDPRVYYFERIPSEMNQREVTVILTMAVISSLIGSLVPALLAARLRPIEALRYE